MPRIRYIKPDFFKDEDLADLPYETRIFYAGLWCQADKAGRLEDRPRRLKAEIFPYDNVDIERCLEQLSKLKCSSKQPFINRYVIGEQRYIQILTWSDHQKPHHTEKESEIPPAPPKNDDNSDLTVKKVKGKEKQDDTTSELDNGDLTVNAPMSGEKSPVALEFTKQCKAVVRAWNKAVPFGQRVPEEGTPAIERTLSTLVNGAPPIGLAEILDCIANYKQALKLPNSQAHTHTLGGFLRREIIEKYAPGVFNITNYDAARFERNSDKDSDAGATLDRLKAQGLV